MDLFFTTFGKLFMIQNRGIMLENKTKEELYPGCFGDGYLYLF